MTRGKFSVTSRHLCFSHSLVLTISEKDGLICICFQFYSPAQVMQEIFYASLAAVHLLSSYKPAHLIPSPWRQFFGNSTGSQEPQHKIIQAHTHTHTIKDTCTYICYQNSKHVKNKSSNDNRELFWFSEVGGKYLTQLVTCLILSRPVTSYIYYDF